VDLRPITAADLPACAEVYFAAENELYERLNLPPLPRSEQALLTIFRHILATDPGLAWLAETGSEVTGFGFGARRDRLNYLSFLFVRPDRQSRGIGRLLLSRCLPADGYRATCVEAVQPVSTALYAAHGMVPRTPIYTLIGQPRHELAGLPADLDIEPLGDAREGLQDTLSAVDELDRQVLGISRRQDHSAWLDWGRRLFVVRRQAGAGRVAGYGYAHQSGRFGPLVVDDEIVLLPLVGELMRRLKAIDAWQVNVPGPAKETLMALLAAGLRLDGPPAIYCASEPRTDHARYLPVTLALP
jgi:GNAT superfamily N-acetyltransferase